MKPIVALLLFASLAANAFLWTRRADDSPRESKPAIAAPNNPAVTPETEIAHESSPTENLAHAVVPLKWADLPVGDLQALAGFLHERGVPPHIVRGIIAHYVDEEYNEKRKALSAQSSPAGYWENSSNSGPEAMALRAELRNLARERNDRLNALVGQVEPVFDPQFLSYIRQRYGNLPTSKAMDLQAIERDYNELQSQVRQASQGVLLTEDREALALIEQERRKDLMAILTPEEYEEFEFRSSNTGSQLRRNLDMMQPTEEEFRTIFRLQRPFDEKYLSSSAPRTPTAFAERQAAERELIAAVKAALGPERGADYEKSRDYSFVHAHSVAKNLGLPKETGDRLWTLQREGMQKFGTVATDASASPAERGRLQLEYVQSLRTAIAAEIGAENLPSYEQGGGGWLRSLEMSANRAINRASPPPPTAR